MAAPMPRPAPVTMATRSASWKRSRIMGSSPFELNRVRVMVGCRVPADEAIDGRATRGGIAVKRAQDSIASTARMGGVDWRARSLRALGAPSS